MIEGIIKAVKQPAVYQGDMQIGFVLQGSETWYNTRADEPTLNELLKTIVKKGNNISFELFDGYANSFKLLEEAKEAPKEKEENTSVVNIKGKDYVTYKGLLEQAHKKGLESFEILEKNISEDMKRAWCVVRAHVKDGKYFDGIGSSTPENTGSMTQDHPVEMAHTRAKGRALRDFLNIGTAMLEELKKDVTSETTNGGTNERKRS